MRPSQAAQRLRESTVAAGADAEPLWWTTSSGLVNRSVGLDAHPRSKPEGGLASRSSLTNAGERKLVAQICPRWNPLTSWMRQIEDFQRAA